MVVMNCICENYDQIEYELNGEEYKEPRKRNRNLCVDCNLEMTADYQRPTLVCRNYGLCEYYPVYVASYIQSYDATTEKEMCI